MHNPGTTEANAGPAWRDAIAAGFDMSLVARNLELTPWERLQNHGRALNQAVTLGRAMEKRLATV